MTIHMMRCFVNSFEVSVMVEDANTTESIVVAAVVG